MHRESSRPRRHASRPLSATVVVPARFHSTRFPGKPLADLDGRPLIEHVYRRASEAPGVDRVIVATDDDRIRAAVAAFGGVAVMTRADHHSGTDRLAEVAASLACDLVVNIQGDEPLVEPGMIAEALAPFAGDPDLPMATLRRRSRACLHLRASSWTRWKSRRWTRSPVSVRPSPSSRRPSPAIRARPSAQ